MAGVKLIHLYGYVSCHTGDAANWFTWGCGNGVNRWTNTIITDSSNHILLPPSQFLAQPPGKCYRVPGFDSLSPELELKVFHDPIGVHQGQLLHLWYAEDLVNHTEEDNGGTTCADVYILYANEEHIPTPKMYMKKINK